MFERFFKSRYWPALSHFLYTASVLIGLPFLIWGVQNLPPYFSNPARAAFAIVALAQSLLNALLAYITPSEPKREPYYDLPRSPSFLFQAIVILAIFGDQRNIYTWSENLLLRWAGLVLYLTGYALSIWANWTWIKHLQREGPRAFDHPVLLFEGPFKRVRHPSVVYLILYCLGLSILFRSWLGLGLIIPLIGGIIKRINNMEKKFETQYKNIWPLRRHTSKRIIPYLY